MSDGRFPLLTAVVFGPALGALLVALVPAARVRLVRGIALTASLAVFLLSLGLWTGFAPRGGLLGVDRIERHDPVLLLV